MSYFPFSLNWYAFYDDIETAIKYGEKKNFKRCYKKNLSLGSGLILLKEGWLKWGGEVFRGVGIYEGTLMCATFACTIGLKYAYRQKVLAQISNLSLQILI